MDKITVLFDGNLLDKEGYECSKIKDAMLFKTVKDAKLYIFEQDEPNNKFKIVILKEI